MLTNTLFLFLLYGALAQASIPCKPKSYRDGIVCVCNAHHCDSLERVTNLEKGQILKLFSNNAGKRFEHEIVDFGTTNTSANFELKVDSSKTFQSIIGFGGAFTDSTGENIASLSQNVQDKLLSSYFSKSGKENL